MVIICCYLRMLPTYALKETGYFSGGGGYIFMSIYHMTPRLGMI